MSYNTIFFDTKVGLDGLGWFVVSDSGGVASGFSTLQAAIDFGGAIGTPDWVAGDFDAMKAALLADFDVDFAAANDIRDATRAAAYEEYQVIYAASNEAYVVAHAGLVKAAQIAVDDTDLAAYDALMTSNLAAAANAKALCDDAHAAYVAAGLAADAAFEAGTAVMWTLTENLIDDAFNAPCRVGLPALDDGRAKGEVAK